MEIPAKSNRQDMLDDLRWINIQRKESGLPPLSVQAYEKSIGWPLGRKDVALPPPGVALPPRTIQRHRHRALLEALRKYIKDPEALKEVMALLPKR